jgi:hypothetical protein
MNKQILQLAKQAGIINWDLLPSGAITPDHESVVKAKKFAKLIVLECASIAARNQAENMDWDISEIIKEHFGIKDE